MARSANCLSGRRIQGSCWGRWLGRALRSPERIAMRHPMRVLSRLPYGRCTAAGRPGPERVKGPMVARITFDGGQSREWRIFRFCACRRGGGGGGVQRAGRARAGGDRPGRPWCPVSPQAREARRPYRRGAVRDRAELCAGAAGVRLRLRRARCSRRWSGWRSRRRWWSTPGGWPSAITAGAVSRDAVVAQFQGNPLPTAVARAVAATRRRPASRLRRRSRIWQRLIFTAPVLI